MKSNKLKVKLDLLFWFYLFWKVFSVKILLWWNNMNFLTHWHFHCNFVPYLSFCIPTKSFNIMIIFLVFDILITSRPNFEIYCCKLSFFSPLFPITCFSLVYFNSISFKPLIFTFFYSKSSHFFRIRHSLTSL